ncbi:MAG: hypothetical protein ACQES8_02085 [Thermodesulfobacteriota bacterium]
MIKPDRSAADTFSLLLTKDSDAPEIDWSTVLNEVRNWGQEYRVEFLDASSVIKQATPGTPHLYIRFKSSGSIIPIAARLYRQLYELSVNFELDKL